MKLTPSTKAKEIKRQWHLVDVSGQILGRISTGIASLLIGKSKPFYVPYLDCGDYVIVVNASKIEVTGRKAKTKTYEKFSGYPGGRKLKSFERLKEENPARIITEAVSGMLPKNKLRDSMLKRLYVFPDANHPYKNQLK